jgi:signal transduction histidine kinase
MRWNLSETCQTKKATRKKRGPSSHPADPPGALAKRVFPALRLSVGEQLERSLQDLVRYYRHSAAGRRCHGIIHNLNAPLQVLSFQLELLEQKAAEEKQYLDDLSGPSAQKLLSLLNRRRHKLTQMRQEIDNLHARVRRLAHQGIHEDLEDRLYLDLNRVYQDELALYEDDLFFKHHVQKHYGFQTGLAPICGHYLDFGQSFRNLVDNALEAMANAKVRRLMVETKLAGKRRLLRVGDTGAGIPAGMAERIFEPFFTTKGSPEHPRAGLGLYMARRLLAPYGGEVQAESSAGETWVTVALPVT